MQSINLSEHFLKGGWLPISHEAHQKYLKACCDAALSKKRSTNVSLLPEVQAFQNFVESDGTILMGFTEMVNRAQITGITDYETLIWAINEIIQKSPTYGSVGPPIYMILAQGMNTNEGFNTFLHTGLNKQFKLMFKYWTNYLESRESRDVLNDGPGGWFSAPALQALEQYYPDKSFFDIFVSVNDPNQYYGFSSFEDFFNRQFQDGIRPLMFPDNPDIINAACESKLYNIATKVNASSNFWLKGEPYSLSHMLQGNYVDEFVGGTVFQGFLEVTGYHRWHSPVTGTIERIVPIEGSYFAMSPSILEGSYYGSAPAAPGPDLSTNPYLRSLAFITSLTTRTLIFIRSDNPLIGLMCFIAIGMTEISTCFLNENIVEGNRVTRGDELGKFKFGGSSHALVFGPKVNITFFDTTNTPGQHVAVRSAIAGVKKADE